MPPSTNNMLNLQKTQISGKELKDRLVVEKIGPAQAKKFLENQGPQRNLRPYKIRQFAEDMTAGQWMFNGAPLVFDKYGKMRDGQNRMHAIIQSGTEHWFSILRNASEAEIASVDTGTSRSFSDVTRMQGVPYSMEIAAAVGYWWRYENNAMNSAVRPSHKMLENLRDQHLNALDQAVRIIANKKVIKSLLPKSIAAFLFAYLLERNREEAITFFELLDAGLGLTDGHPVHHLRRLLIANQARRLKQNPIVLCAYLIKTFNAFHTDKKVRALVYKTNEEFPTILI
jgi:hypothetical protein